MDWNETITTLSSIELNEFINSSKSIEFKNGELIFKQNAPITDIVYLQKGIIKTIKKHENNSITFNLNFSPCFVDLSNLFGKKYYKKSAYCLTNSNICFIEKELFDYLLANNKKFARKVTEYICNFELVNNDRYISWLHKNVSSRFASFLIYLSENVYCSEELLLPMKKYEIAQLLSVSYKSFIRTFNEFKRDRLISQKKKFIKIINKNLINKISKS